MSVTPPMLRVMRFLQRYADSHDGVSPTYAEIARGVGVRSCSNISSLLDRLEERGFIVRLPHKRRAITLLKRVPDRDGPLNAYRSALLDIAAGEADPQTHARDVLERFR